MRDEKADGKGPWKIAICHRRVHSQGPRRDEAKWWRRRTTMIRTLALIAAVTNENGETVLKAARRFL